MARLAVIAQDFDIYDGHPHARTGEISLRHLRDAGADGIILGHSEVGDPADVINKKLQRALSQGFGHIVVLGGETWEEFQDAQRVVVEKFERSLQGLSGNIILGYEPAWGTRGSGRDDVLPPQPDHIHACVCALKERFTGHPIIYGGRSDPERAEVIMRDAGIQGFILGSACDSVQKTLSIAGAMGRAGEKIIVCNFKAYELKDSYEDYVHELKKLPDDFLILLAPPYTDIRLVASLL